MKEVISEQLYSFIFTGKILFLNEKIEAVSIFNKYNRLLYVDAF